MKGAGEEQKNMARNCDKQVQVRISGFWTPYLCFPVPRIETLLNTPERGKKKEKKTSFFFLLPFLVAIGEYVVF